MRRTKARFNTGIAAFLSFSLIASLVAFPVTAYATEAADEGEGTVIVTDPVSDESALQETSGDASTPQDPEGTVSTEDDPTQADSQEGESVTAADEEFIGNSFRFENGVPINGIGSGSSNGISLMSTRSTTYSFNKSGEGSYYSTPAYYNVNGAVGGLGIDVSEWNGNIDWAAVKSSGLVDFAIIRCGYSTAGMDDKFINNVKGCIANGIPFGVYLYSYGWNTTDARNEAEHVLSLLRNAGVNPSNLSYPVYYDLENQNPNTGHPAGVDGNGNYRDTSNSTLEQMASTFCSIISEAGYTPGIYANLNWWNNYLTGSSFNQWARWVAQYNVRCDYTGNYDIWQATSSGRISGISGNVDVNFDFGYDVELGGNQNVWSRVYGQNQLDTMAAVSKKGWSSSDSVVIATQAHFWDALSASSLAGLYDCPIILTSGSSLSAQAKSEIQRLGAKTAYVCGGPIAISSSVDAQIRAAGCSNVVRVYGQDQQGTAREIAERVKDAVPSDTCIIATSWKFQDALSISPYAYATKTPIYIAESGSNKLSEATLQSIRSNGFKKVIIVGGPIAVSSSVESQLASIGISGSNVNRMYGQTEYETSLAIAKWELTQGMQVSRMAVATGSTFYDALSGSALCGKNNAVLVIVSKSNRVCISDFIGPNSAKIDTGYVLGGPIAVSVATWNYLLRTCNLA